LKSERVIHSNEIATSTGVRLLDAYKKPSFYVLILLIVVVCVYYYCVYKYETALLKYQDNEFCISFRRSQLIPEMAEIYKQKIREGKVTDLVKAMEILKRLYKNESNCK